MKKNKGLIISIAILIIVYTFFCIYTEYNKILKVSSMKEHKLYYTKRINIQKEQYYINIEYPYTIYNNPNNYIYENIQKYIEDFETLIESKIEMNEQKYFLNISYEVVETKKYLDFEFNIQKNIGGIHPENSIFTVNIDKNNKEIITIEDLQTKYNKYLDKVSKYCYKELKNSKNIQEYGAYELLEMGTNTRVSNFSNFIIKNNTIDIIFEHSAIAPYSLGVFRVVIPLEYFEEINNI